MVISNKKSDVRGVYFLGSLIQKGTATPDGVAGFFSWQSERIQSVITMSTTGLGCTGKSISESVPILLGLFAC